MSTTDVYTAPAKEDWREVDQKILDPTWYTDLSYLDTFRSLRDEDPVHWTEDDAYGKHYWFLSRHEDVANYLEDHRTFSSRIDTRVPKTPRAYKPEERYELGFLVSMARNDPPTHDLYRKPLNKHFSIPAVAKLREDVERIVQEIIDGIGETREVEFVEEVAGELPARVILRMLGVPEADWAMLKLAAWQWVASADPKFMIDDDPLYTYNHGQRTLMEYCEALAHDRQESPRDDFATVLSQMEVDGERLSAYELRSILLIVIAGGLESTRNTSAMGLWLLLTHPDQRRKLIEDPELANPGVEEILRYSTPTRTRLRVATQDVELRGKSIRTGDWVVASHASANRDERVFHDPDRFDITRNPNPHLSFGAGVHFCLGRALARLQIGTLLKSVVQAFPDMEPLGDPIWIADNTTTGFTSYPVFLGSRRN
ncbi:cytochrome P450 [Glaciibacter sp. 2TAF33]|uniref:cytochrome P450 n=1 Tax=Glaciibacter sp. 2TAF33 TaxID=3233015 RepID=UPI003F905296